MHELGIATEIYRACQARMEEHLPARLESVTVAVGELSAVEPDLLRYAWEAVVGTGPHQGARLEIDWRPARQSCAGCGEVAERAPGTWLRLCPQCERPLQVEGGDELDLLRFTLVPPGGERSDHVHGSCSR